MVEGKGGICQRWFREYVVTMPALGASKVETNVSSDKTPTVSWTGFHVSQNGEQEERQAHEMLRAPTSLSNSLHLLSLPFIILTLASLLEYLLTTIRAVELGRLLQRQCFVR